MRMRTASIAIRLLAALLFLPLTAAGQPPTISLDRPALVPQSPEASAMERWRHYPVSHCTGLPEITIPIYEIEAGEVTIPVTLSYHAAGLRPKDGCGPAGTGWTLSLAPALSRQVNGLPDETPGYGWLYRGLDSNAAGGGLTEENLKAYYGEVLDGTRDIRPNRFTYTLPHGGGGGYFSRMTDYMTTIPRGTDRVTIMGVPEIVDAQGVRYVLGGGQDRCDETVTRWQCSAIYSALHEGQELVTFSYGPSVTYLHPDQYYSLKGRLVFTQTGTGYDTRTYLTRHYVEDTHGILEPSTGDGVTLESRPLGYDGRPPLLFTPPAGFTGREVSRQRLTGAAWFGLRLRLTYRTVGRGLYAQEALDSMAVTGPDGRTLRTVRFYISPYSDRTSLPVSTRCP